MKNINLTHQRRRIALCAFVATYVMLLLGCQVVSNKSSGSGQSINLSGKPGAQLWTESCNRCHNYRSPNSYTDTQWQVAIHHMRVRANLTAEESSKIMEFLKSAN